MIWSQTSNPLASRSLLPLDSNKQVESSDIQGRRESLVQFTASNVLFTTTLRYQRTWSYPFLEGNFLCLFHLRLVSQPEFSQDKRSTVSLTGVRASENIRGAGRERSTRLQAEDGRNSHRRRQPEAVRQVGKPGLTGESKEPSCLGTNMGAHGDIYEAASLTFKSTPAGDFCLTSKLQIPREFLSRQFSCGTVWGR